MRSPEDTVTQAQALLDAGKPFHAHEVFEDAWKSGPEGERALWRGLAQLAVGLTHAARGTRRAVPGYCGAGPGPSRSGRPGPSARAVRTGWSSPN